MSHRPLRLACALVATVFALGCQDTTAPSPATLDVLVAEARVTASVSSGVQGSFAVNVSFSNPGDVPVRVTSPLATVEREVVPERWEIVIEPVYTLIDLEALEVAPRSVVSRQETISASLGGGAVPSFPNGVIAGRYRLLYRYVATGSSGAFAEARSPAFDVVVE